MIWYEWGLVFLAFVVHGRVVRKLTERVTKLEEDAPLPDKHYAPDIDAFDRCYAAPVGWRCTRKFGHPGPCAAVPCAADGAT